MGGARLQEDEQASEPVEIVNTDSYPSDSPVNDSVQCMDRVDQTPVLIDLLKQVPPLVSESPEDILNFLVRLGEIQNLGLVEDRNFIIRILPLVPRGLLQF
jgi:hypothetical protein